MRKRVILDRRFETRIYDAVGAGGAGRGYGYTMQARAKRPKPGARGLDEMAVRISNVAEGMAKRELKYRKGPSHPWRRTGTGERYVNAFHVRRTKRGQNPIIRVVNQADSAHYVEHGNEGPRTNLWYRLPVKHNVAKSIRAKRNRKNGKRKRGDGSRAFLTRGKGGYDLMYRAPLSNTSRRIGTYKGRAILLRAMRQVAAEYFKR